jgi:serine/threonine-protein kinase
MVVCARCQTALEPGARFCSRCGYAVPGTDPTLRDMAQTPVMAPDPMIGRQVIGQYVIRRKLGEGGMGAVYLADQPSVGRNAVIKVLHPQFTRDPQMASRFEIEARAAARLTNPHIVAIYNYGDMGDGTLFLAMEHLDGQNLDDLIRGAGRLAPVRAVRIVVQACDALAEAHRAGIVHRDLKPSNIMLVPRGRDAEFVKVLDFGIAKLEGVKMTATGAVFGTPQYMSPEQLRGERLDGRSDLYSLAVILYELLAGQLPFRSETPAGYMHKHISEPPPAMRTIDPGLEVPAALEQVVRSALAKDPADRPATADAFAEALEAAVERAPGRLAEPPAVAAVPTVSPVGPATQRGRRLRARAAWALGGLAAAASAIVLVEIVGRMPHPHRHPPDGGAGTLAHTPAWTPSAPAPSQRVPAAAPDAAVAPAPSERADRAAPRPSPPAASHLAPTVRKVARAKAPPAEHPVGPNPGPPPAPGETAAPPPGARDVASPGTAPLNWPMPAGSEELLSRPIPELEAELKRLLAHSRLPPSAIRQTLEGYVLNARMAPEADRDRWRRSYLINLIVAYRKPEMRLPVSEDRPLDELIGLFKTMSTKTQLDDQTRQRILETSLKAYDGDSFKPEDRDFYRRMAVAGLIKSYAEDPRLLEKQKKK